tara:strand:+ start:744 stop:1193 length:450 start_codon:yes stop_codon:yes gene_type:complete
MLKAITAYKTIQDVPQKLNRYGEVDKYNQFDIFEVGDGATISLYTDAHAGTVIEVKRGGKEVTVQRDKATLDKGWKPEIVPGGFAGHCTNQGTQVYTYERDPEGGVQTFTLRKVAQGEYARFVWTRKGEAPNGYAAIYQGRNEYYDYNF